MKFKMTPSKLMIALFAVVLIGMPVATIALPKAERSENENRTLAKFPSLINQAKMDKAEGIGEVMDAVKWDYITVRDKPSFMDDIETYYADHLAGRESWVSAKNQLERLIGKQEINGVYTVDDNMIQVFKEYSKEDIEANMSAMAKFQENHPELPCYIMLAPTAQEMLYSKMPSYNGYINEKNFIEECYKQAGKITTIDSLSYLSGHKDEYLYYRTDHHWTSLGAYYAYCSAAKALGYTPYGLNSFNIESASAAFRGTLYSKTLDNGVTPDTIDYYHLKDGEPKITMEITNSNGVKGYTAEAEHAGMTITEFLKAQGLNQLTIDYLFAGGQTRASLTIDSKNSHINPTLHENDLVTRKNTKSYTISGDGKTVSDFLREKGLKEAATGTEKITVKVNNKSVKDFSSQLLSGDKLTYEIRWTLTTTADQNGFTLSQVLDAGGAGGEIAKADEITVSFATADADTVLTEGTDVWVQDKLIFDTLYVREHLDTKDKYASFTGTNAPLIEIETDVDNGKSLLLVKDSYAHSLVPFLSKHYSKITMVDMRYIGGDLNMFMDVNSFSHVLFMYNAVSFAGDTSAAKIALTK